MTRKVNYTDPEQSMNKRTSNTNQPLRRLLLAILLSALVAGCGSGTISGNFNGNGGGTTGGGGTGGTGGGGGTGDTGGGGGGTGALCTGTGLAATDLSGRCRATPQATMGALEAVS